MSRFRGGLLGLTAFAGGVAAGAAAEELLYRRAFRRDRRGEPEPAAPVEGEPLRAVGRDGTELYAECFGPADAPAVVFLHGFTLDHRVWHHQLRDLARLGRWRLVAVDARGHGRAGPVGAGRLDPETLAHDLYAVLRAVGFRPTVVVGHSMGGMTAQALLEFAKDFPEEVGPHVRGFALVNTTFTSSLGAWRPDGVRLVRLRKALLRALERVDVGRLRLPPSDLALLLTRLGFGERPRREDVAFTRRMIQATPTETLAAGMKGLADFDGLEGLGRIDVPVLVLAGTRDVVTPPHLAEEMIRRIPEAELVLLEGAGHMAMLERHREVTAALRDFCERMLP